MKKTDAQRYQDSVRRRPAKNENCLQEAIVAWCRGYGYAIVQGRFTASANGWSVASASAKDRAIQGWKLKKRGLQPGWPDLEFFSSRMVNGTQIGTMLFLEVKLGTMGVLSGSQNEVHALLRENGHRVVVVRDLASAITTIMAFYALK